MENGGTEGAPRGDGPSLKIDFFFALKNYGLPNRVGRVFSEKMKNASTHHETEYAVLIGIMEPPKGGEGRE
jgi:hypothetical protein